MVNTTVNIPENQDEYLVEANYVMRNPNLPGRGTKIAWTDDMMKILAKCKKDILFFAENFFYIINLDEGRQKIKLYPVQKKELKLMAENNRVCIVSSRQQGKCLHKNAKIRVRYKPLNLTFSIKIGVFYVIQKINRFLVGLIKRLI